MKLRGRYELLNLSRVSSLERMNGVHLLALTREVSETSGFAASLAISLGLPSVFLLNDAMPPQIFPEAEPHPGTRPFGKP